MHAHAPRYRPCSRPAHHALHPCWPTTSWYVFSGLHGKAHSRSRLNETQVRKHQGYVWLKRATRAVRVASLSHPPWGAQPSALFVAELALRAGLGDPARYQNLAGEAKQHCSKRLLVQFVTAAWLCACEPHARGGEHWTLPSPWTGRAHGRARLRCIGAGLAASNKGAKPHSQ